MPRIAFKLRIKQGAIKDYEEAHRHVWPELLAKGKEAGVSDFSIFRRGHDLFLCMRVIDVDRTFDMLDKDPVNARWQKEMSRFLEPVPDLRPDEPFAMMKEIFYME